MATVAGAAIGYFIGGSATVSAFFGVSAAVGAMWGARIGGLIGGYLFQPSQTIEGPRLSDLSVQTSTYGAAIPRVYGTVATHGNIFWLERDQIRERSKKKRAGGKGGGGQKVKTYTYSATFAVGLCRGPIAGVRRIWVGPKLIYDAGSNDLETIIASNQAAKGFRVYLGTDTQNPDPRMQADKGVANTPAYRGLAYIVFYDYPLKDHGNSLMGAQVKVEVVKVSSKSQALVESAVFPSDFNAGMRCSNPESDTPIVFTFHSAVNSSSWPVRVDVYRHVRGSAPIKLYSQNMPAVNGRLLRSVSGSGQSKVSDCFITRPGSPATPTSYYLAEYNGELTYHELKVGLFLTYSPSFYFDGTNVYMGSDFTTGGTAIRKISKFSGEVIATAAEDHATLSICEHDGLIWATYGPYAVRAYDAATLGLVHQSPAITGIGVSGSNHIHEIQTSSFGLVARLSNPDSVYIYKDGVWTYFGFTASVAVTGLSTFWGNFNPETGTFVGVSTWPLHNGPQLFITTKIFEQSQTIPLSQILQSETLQSNLITAGDIVTSSLTDQVRGYRVAQPGAIRGAIEPLQAAWPFDVVQSGYQIKFQRRGAQSSVLTIPASKLDARPAMDSAGHELTIDREMDTQLPREIRLQYLDTAREYDVNEQIAERLGTDTVNRSDIQLPIVLTATEAARKSESLLYLAWLERYDVSLKLPPEYLALEPADVITVTGEWGEYSLRLTEITYTADGRLECRAKFDSAAIYESFAEADTGNQAGAVIGLDGPSIYRLLDVPMLISEQINPSFLTAMAGYTTGWPGGVIFRSTDGGATWDDLQGFVDPVTMGFARNTIPARDSRMIDYASSLQVDVVAGALDSVTELQMLNGANVFAYGAPGRWEIIHAQNCTLQADGSYILTSLLRGRQGTEWASGLHAAGDALVMLSDPDVALVGSTISQIGVPHLWRGITATREIDSDADYAWAYEGENLKAQAPVNPLGTRSSGNLTITFNARTRAFPDWVMWRVQPVADAPSFEIDVMSGSTVVRTLTGTTPSITYTSAQQTTDFGAPQSSVVVRIYHVSETMGRSRPLEVTL